MDKVDYAHRVSWIIHYGYIPQGMHILHHCDNPPCVNPEHLELGTAKDNMRHREERGRGKGFLNIKKAHRLFYTRTKLHKGVGNPNSKLNDNDISNIRLLRQISKPLKFTIKELSELYKISPSQIGRIVCNQQWKHLLKV